WMAVSTAVIANASHHNWPAGIADPRLRCEPRSGVYGVIDGAMASGAVIGNARPDNGAWSIADARLDHSPRNGSLQGASWGDPARTVIGNARYNKGAASVYDPRAQLFTHHLEAGNPVALLGPDVDLESTQGQYLVIRALDGTWHRALTTLELAALQGLPTEINGAPLVLDGGRPT